MVVVVKAKVNTNGSRKSASQRGKARGGQDAVFETLKARIASHELPPGSKLRENELAAEFGVSRTRVREVFGALEQRGLIERIPNRGAIVTRLELKQASDLYDVLEYMEALCVKRATINAPDGAWDDMVETIERLSLGEMTDDGFDIYLGYLEESRKRIIRYSDNPILSSILDLLFDRTQVIARRVVILPGRIHDALKMHGEMLRAMKRRDPETAERSRREILSSARDMLGKYQRFIL